MKELSDICNGDLYCKLKGNYYCSVGLRKKIICKYQSPEVDYNQLYRCQHLKHFDINRGKEQ